MCRYCESRRRVLLQHVHEGYDKDLWEYIEDWGYISTPQTLGDKLHPLERWCNDNRAAQTSAASSLAKRPALHHFSRFLFQEKHKSKLYLSEKVRILQIKYYKFNSIVSSVKRKTEKSNKKAKYLPFACIVRSCPQKSFPSLSVMFVDVWLYFIYSFCVWKMDFVFKMALIILTMSGEIRVWVAECWL